MKSPWHKFMLFSPPVHCGEREGGKRVYVAELKNESKTQ